MAITVAQHDAREALKNHPGFGPDAAPPIAAGMSVSICSPAGPLTRHFTPVMRMAVAGECWLSPFPVDWRSFGSTSPTPYESGNPPCRPPEQVHSDAGRHRRNL